MPYRPLAGGPGLRESKPGPVGFSLGILQNQTCLHLRPAPGLPTRPPAPEPSPPADLTKAERACDEKFSVPTGIQILTDSLGMPDLPPLRLVLRKRRPDKGILAYHPPPDCLLEGCPHQLVDFYDGAGTDIYLFTSSLPVCAVPGRCGSGRKNCPQFSPPDPRAFDRGGGSGSPEPCCHSSPIRRSNRILNAVSITPVPAVPGRNPC